MAKESFKIGDQVVPIEPERWQQGNNIGTVVEVSTKRITVEWKEWKWNGTVRESFYQPSDIKRWHPKNTQLLLFNF